MSLFNRIKEKLGFGVSNEAHASAAPNAGNAQQPTDTVVADAVNNATSAPSALSVVDVSANLDGMAASHSEKLNWRTSIVDLLKLLGL